MKKVILVSMIVGLASGCASISQDRIADSYYHPGIETTPEQARAYIAELQLKKKRFKERQLLAQAAAFSDPEQIADNQQTELASECEGISKGEWATSVLYGQDFLSYENHVETMKRCFEQENKNAGLSSDLTTAMN